MTMQSDQNSHPSFLQSPTGQTTLLVVVAIVVLILAWRYVF
jgi:hypothetical protein